MIEKCDLFLQQIQTTDNCTSFPLVSASSAKINNSVLEQTTLMMYLENRSSGSLPNRWWCILLVKWLTCESHNRTCQNKTRNLLVQFRCVLQLFCQGLSWSQKGTACPPFRRQQLKYNLDRYSSNISTVFPIKKCHPWLKNKGSSDADSCSTDGTGQKTKRLNTSGSTWLLAYNGAMIPCLTMCSGPQIYLHVFFIQKTVVSKNINKRVFTFQSASLKRVISGNPKKR